MYAIGVRTELFIKGGDVYGCGHIERTWSVSQLIIDVHFPWSRVFSAE